MLIPLLFMRDVVGRLFREFAITLSVTILISAVVSLTCRPDDVRQTPTAQTSDRTGAFYRHTQRLLDRVIAGYGRSLRWVLNHQRATLAVAVGTLMLTVLLYVVIPKGFSPFRIPV